ncbi:pancreatic lipase-related protein 2-like [Anticarsia gemmatalis]|uniref:pancreatic lipase-related protein 2-like n=1 Tax=Anticarsia gemmatalis TaxID=129554 RepID=UPI003F770AD1
MKWIIVIVFVSVVVSSNAQREPSIPLSPLSFRQITRGLSPPPMGRSPVTSDIIIRHYSRNSTSPNSRRIGNIKQLLKEPSFDVNRPTVVYAHGYVEKVTDESVATVVSAYLRVGGYNLLVVDWSNIAFGNYIVVAKRLPATGEAVGIALSKLLKRGLSLKGLHLVGHSMGAHLVSYAARYLMARGYTVPRMTGLDPAYPGFYPPIVAPHMSPSDATFVDVIHTDGGYFGTPASTGHADFWPNGGTAKQPGCVSATIPLTNEDFCSHFRSWLLWSESVTGDALLARRCEDYDTFLRGDCQDEPLVFLGIRATPDLRGNYYLRTAAKPPYGLGLRGVS